jgi:hypothetical protein
MGRAIATILLAACASVPPAPQRPTEPGSRGMRASEHLEAARDQDHQAQQDQMWPDTRPIDTSGRVDQPVDIPWRRQWDSAEQHQRLAVSHRAAAAELQAEFQRACGSRSQEDIARSPIARFGIGGVPAEHGAIVFLAGEAGPANHLLADIECHRAWMMLDANPGMDACPFDLADVHFDAVGDEGGITLQITARDPTIVQELQRRVARDLELRTTKQANH